MASFALCTESGHQSEPRASKGAGHKASDGPDNGSNARKRNCRWPALVERRSDTHFEQELSFELERVRRIRGNLQRCCPGGGNPFMPEDQVFSERLAQSQGRLARPFTGTEYGHYRERYRSGQPGQTVNLLAYAYGGSNPPLSTCLLYTSPSPRD